MATKYTFTPDYAVPPGATLRELLESKGMSQSDLAIRTGLTEKTISQVINGAAPISYETAAKLELAIGVSARFWNNRESQYREALILIEEKARLESEIEWLNQIPVKELVERGYVQPSSDKGCMVREVLRFFQVSSVAAWNALWLNPHVRFRGGASHDSRPGFVAAWVRMGEVAADKIHCAPYSEKSFRSALKGIRSLTTEPAGVWQPKLTEMCSACGVAVVLVKEIPRAGVSGATKWLGKDKAMILLSLKYKSDDQFWFSCFHEIRHVIAHSKKETFIEGAHRKDSPEEQDADAFARDILIPPEFSGELPFLKSKDAIRAFARRVGIAPGIVVGRLHHDRFLPPSYCVDLKVKYAWKDP